MSVAAILLPVFVQVALTFALLFSLGPKRIAALRRKEVKLGEVALDQNSWPPALVQIGNAFNNQFQLPVLFYVLVVLALFLRKADLLFVILSWVFVISRIVHAAVHSTSNSMGRRFAAFVIGATVLLIMWAIFAIRILFGL
jgi:hypothetical protein